jgi:hypothetical protein
VTTISLAHFALKQIFFYFEKRHSFPEKNLLKPVGVRSLTAAFKNFFFAQKPALFDF